MWRTHESGGTCLGLQVLIVLSEKPPKITALCLCKKLKGWRRDMLTVNFTFLPNIKT